MWWNGRHRGLKIPCHFLACGFESRHQHHSKYQLLIQRLVLFFYPHGGLNALAARTVLYGLILIVLGIACSALSATTGGSEAQNFVSGLLMGLSIVEMLTGIAVIGKKLLRG